MTTQALSAWVRLHRRACLSVFDVTAWGLALVLAAWARGDFRFAHVHWGHALLCWAMVAALYTLLAHVVGLHRGRAALASLDETLLLGITAVGTGATCFTANLFLHPVLIPRSVPVISTLLAVVLMSWGRASWRAASDRGRTTTPSGNAQAVLVMGAGDAGRQLIRSMQTDGRGQWWPVGLLDDDPYKKNLRICGVPVRGTSADIPRLADATGARIVVIAIPSVSADVIQRVSRQALDAGLRVKVLPGVASLFGASADIRDVRDLNLEDLLGRRQIETDLGSIARFITGKRILVTGAGGSIGSELCRQLHSWGPTDLIMLDRDESALHAVQLSISGRALLDTPDVVLADIRDDATILEIFKQHRPQVVFHAAALKHLPMLEQYPGEGLQTNVWGTLALLNASRATGVDTFVNISTDKAADPTSVLGYTKRLAERLTAHAGAHGDGSYISVRFGNVLGSRGSVLTTFTAQIAAGGPVTVTDRHMMRYFMTVKEAVQLVIQAAAIGRSGEALVLDMGQPVSIDSVARQLIQLSGSDIDVVYTGLRAGEKLSERLRSPHEPDHRPIHPLISHVTVPTIDPSDVRALDPWAGSADVIVALSATSSLGERATVRV